jgi:hypothetical protein
MDRNLLHDGITTIDDALTRPWQVKKTYRRVAAGGEDVYAENNSHVAIGRESLFSQRRWPPDAGQERSVASVAAGLALFSTEAQLTRGVQRLRLRSTTT